MYQGQKLYTKRKTKTVFYNQKNTAKMHTALPEFNIQSNTLNVVHF